jgi:hypothetical protein
MGYSPFYQAIPEASDLYRGLEADPRMAQLLAYLFPYGSRPLDLWEDGELLNDPEALDHFVKWHPLFASRADAEATLHSLSQLIDRTSESYPGLIDRVAFVEKSLDQIEDRLRSRVEPALLGRALKSDGWLFSSEDLSPSETLQTLSQSFGIVSRSRVELVASVLDEIDGDSLFDQDEDHLLDDLKSLKELYRIASELGEAILIL